MRKVKLQMQLTIDGLVAGPKGELDWMTWNWTDDIKNYVNDLTDPIDCILLGKNMTEGFISHWKKVTQNSDDPEYPFAKKMYDTPKIVFSKTLEKSDPLVKGWNNTVLAKRDISEEINELKKQPGKDIVVYGGANFVSNLIKYDLIDEYQLFINPVVIGNGMTIFKEREQKLNLKLVKATPFDCGIVALCYYPDRQ